MNFLDLMSKLKNIEESEQPPIQAVSAAPSAPTFPDDGQAQLECGDEPTSEPMHSGDMLTGECGEMGPVGAPKQADNVTMNVSINGSGAGGIKNLIDILRNIEGGSHDGHDGKDMIVGVDEVIDGDFGSATTEPDETTFGTDIMTRAGGDLASKGVEAPKVNGGGNAMQEALLKKLSARYEEIKNS